ncbi:glycosyltransferase [Streptomyces sp. MI02-7b]|uniref:glycosyltransferase n=1 Tax=Streptomyces sp. MI02-7b TaxID=462941 RepID=UPI0039F4C33F
MRVGLPVAGADCPLGPGEVVAHGTDGLLVPPGDTDAMAAAPLRLINDDETPKRMGRAALLKGAHHEPRRVAGVYTDLLQGLLDRRSGAAGRVRGVGRHAGGTALATAYAGKDAAKAALRSFPSPPKAGKRAEGAAGRATQPRTPGVPVTARPTAPPAPTPSGGAGRRRGTRSGSGGAP